MSSIKDEIAKLRHRNFLMLIGDVAISVLASLFAVLFIRWQAHAFLHFQTYLFFWMSLSIVASLIAFLVFRTHKMVIFHASMRLVSNLLYASAVKELILLACVLTNLFNIHHIEPVRLLIFVDFAFTLLMLLIVRLVTTDIISFSQKDLEESIAKLSVMVYGVSDKSASMVARLSQSRRFIVRGFLSRERFRDGQIVSDYEVYYFNDEKDIEDLKAKLGFESVLFSNDIDAQEEKDHLVTICLQKGINVLMTPKVESVNYGGMTTKAIKAVVDSDFIPDNMSSFERNTKRVVDMILSGILLVAFSPLFLICWIAIRIGDGGPVIFSQERIGRFGRPFKIYKFRSMRTDAEIDGPALLSGEDDPRLTKVGGFLRRHHLDELPQLWNVFRGDIAFVGYRPERKYYIDKIMEVDPRYYYLYQIRPGVTSYATLRNGYTFSMDKMLRRLEFDLYYLRHRSWWFDMMVLWQTFCSIVFGKKF